MRYFGESSFEILINKTQTDDKKIIKIVRELFFRFGMTI